MQTSEKPILPDFLNFSLSSSEVDSQEETDELSKARARFRHWLWGRVPAFMISLIILITLLVILWNRVIIIINPGYNGVLFHIFSGTEVDYVYTEGLNIINPLNTMYIYETRKQVALHEFNILSNKGLTITLSLAIRYQPEVEVLGLLHQRIGPDYLNRVIIPQIESVMRKQLGNYDAEDIYTNKEGLLTNAILLALDEVGRNYVKVEDIIIRSISMPDKIKAAIEDKLSQEELAKSYDYRLQVAQKEAERLGIEAKGIHEYHATIDQSMSQENLKYEGIQATKELAKSQNAKIIVVGSGKDGLPLILNTE
jgi:regulator of protease activity HflC (stomatin/prohibitin superfamily)